MMRPVPVERLTPERRRQLTREALIDAAGEVFARKGFYGAAMEEIAEAAGFTRGAIYSNFGSKEELLLAVLDRYLDSELHALSGAMAEGGPDAIAGAMAAAAVSSEVQRLTPNWPALELELRLSALRNPAVRDRLVESERQNREKVVGLIEEEAARAGATLRVDARDFADISRAAHSGLTQLAALDPDVASRFDRLVQTLFVMLAEAAIEPEG
jgi:AcrR family transcriptional regulator